MRECDNWWVRHDIDTHTHTHIYKKNQQHANIYVYIHIYIYHSYIYYHRYKPPPHLHQQKNISCHQVSFQPIWLVLVVFTVPKKQRLPKWCYLCNQMIAMHVRSSTISRIQAIIRWRDVVVVRVVQKRKEVLYRRGGVNIHSCSGYWQIIYIYLRRRKSCQLSPNFTL